MKINLKQAARLAGFKSASLLLYYIDRYNEPEYEIIAGCKVFEPEKVREWKNKLIDNRKKDA
jgi:hypothetical protein